MIVAVGDEHVAAAVHRHSPWIRQTCARAGPPVTAEAAHAVPRHRRDDPRARGQPSDAVIVVVGDEHVAAAIHRHSTWPIQTRARAGPPVAAEAVHAIPRHRRDDPRARGQPPDAVVVGVGDEHVAAAVHRHSYWIKQTRSRGLLPVAVEALHACPRESCYKPRDSV